jgi:hypothetical protein
MTEPIPPELWEVQTKEIGGEWKFRSVHDNKGWAELIALGFRLWMNIDARVIPYTGVDASNLPQN